MRLTLIFFVVVVTTAVTFSQSVNSGNPVIDPYLLEHSIFGLEWITASNSSTTPEGGLVGTPGYFKDSYNLTVNGTLLADSIDGVAGSINVHDSGSITYQSKSSQTDFAGAISNVSQIGTTTYPLVPSFPDLSGSSYPQTNGDIINPGTYYPGDYGKLTPNSTNPLYLTAGIYSFTEIALGWEEDITIIPDASGNYKTIIYVNSSIAINSSADFKVQDSTGYGQVLILYQGSSKMTLKANASIEATVIAPNATVDFEDNAKLKGQVLAKRVGLLGFKAGKDLQFEPFKQSKVTVTPDYFKEDPTVDSGDVQFPHVANDQTGLKLTLTLDAPAADSNGIVVYEVVTGSGTGFATHTEDFTMTSPLTDTLIFLQDGAITQEIILQIHDDNIFEGIETFDIVFHSLTGNISLGSDSLVHTISIIDDDPDNQSPTDLTLSNLSFDEESGSDFNIGTLGTSDNYPSDDTHTYLIRDAASSTFKTTNGEFKIAGNALHTAKNFDFELDNSTYTITLRVTDSYAESFDSTFTITLNPLNDSTNINRDTTYTINENDVITGAQLPIPHDGDKEQSNNRFRYEVIDQPLHSLNFTYAAAAGTFDYVPTSANAEFPVDSFSYRVIDSTTYDLSTNTGKKRWALITINNVNDEKPVAADDNLVLFEGESDTVFVLSNDSSPFETGDDLTISKIIGSGTVGSFTVAADKKSIIYTHDGSNETPFTESVSYEISDNGTPLPLFDTASITVEIKPINDNKAVAANDGYTIPKGDTLKVPTASGVLINDTDADRHPTLPDGNTLSASYIAGSASHGSVTMNSDGSFTYVNDGQNGVSKDTLKYILADGITYEDESKAPFTHINADTGLVIITITPNHGLNDPTALDGSMVVEEKMGSSAEITLLGTLVNDGDIGGGDQLTLTYTGGTYGNIAPATGTKLTSSTKLIYTYNHSAPTEEFSDQISYTVTDLNGTSASGIISITITKLNDNAPVIPKDTVNASFGKVNTVVIPTATDLDKPEDQTNIVIDSTIANSGIKGILTPATEGTVTWLTNTSFGYMPNLTSTATIDSFQYQILDSVSYDAVTVHREPQWIYVTIDQGSKGDPIAVLDQITVHEGGSVSGNVMSNDLKATVGGVANSGPELDSVRIVKSPSYDGSFSLNRDGSFTYNHDDSEHFTDQFSYILVDQSGAESGEQIVTISINKKNDNTPIAPEIGITLDEGSQKSVSVLSGLQDTPETDVETEWVVSLNGTYGGAKLADSVSLDATGTLTYFHNGTDVIFSDTVRLIVKDSTPYDIGSIHEIERLVVVTINPVDDNDPTAQNTAVELFEGETITIDVSTLIEDLDGTPITIDTASSPTMGTITSISGTTFTYVHDGSNEKPFVDGFTYTAKSESKVSLPATITIAIKPINDNRSVAAEDKYSVKKGKTLTITASAGVLINDTDNDRHPTLNHGNVLTASYKAGSARHGSVVLNSDGSFNYTNDGQNGITADTFMYYLHDSISYVADSKAPFGFAKADSQLVVINIEENYALNDPVATPGTLTVEEKNGSFAEIQLLNNLISDGDLGGGDEITFSYLDPKYGTVTPTSGLPISDGSVLRYMYNQNIQIEEFVDTIYYTARDKNGTESSSYIAVTITALNDNRPNTSNDSVKVVFGTTTPVTIPTVQDGDIPVPTITLDSTVITAGAKGIATAPTEGTVTWISNNSFSYEPNINSIAVIDSFQYAVLDSVNYDAVNVHRDSAWIYVVLDQSSKGSPLATADSYSLDEGASVTGNVMTNDLTATVNGTADAGPALDSVRLITAPLTQLGGQSSFVLNRDGSFTFTHNHSEFFSDQFTYVLVDVTGKESANQTVTLSINPLNDNTPDAPELHYSLDEGDSAQFDVLGGVSDLPESDIETHWVLSLNGVNGSAKLADSVLLDKNAGTIRYYHDGTDVVLEDTVRIWVQDSTLYDQTNIHTVERLIIITVNPIDDNLPTAQSTTVTIHEGESVDIDLNSLINDNDGTVLTIDTTSSPSRGTITTIAGNVITYQHDGSLEAPFIESFHYIAKSGNFESVPALITIRITPINDNSADAVDDAYTVQKGGTLDNPPLSVLNNDTDADQYNVNEDRNVFTVELKDSTVHGTIVFNSDGTFIYQNDGSNGVAIDSFTYYISDSIDYASETIAPYSHTRIDSATVRIGIETNFDLNKPTAQEDSLTLPETNGASAEISLLGTLVNDGDLGGGDQLTLTVTQPKWGTVTPLPGTVLTVDSKLNYTYTQSADIEEFVDTVYYSVEDRAGNTAQSFVEVTIVPLNDNAPTVDTLFVTAQFGKAAAITLPTVADIDLPAEKNVPVLDAVNDGIVRPVSEGTLTKVADSEFSYVVNFSSAAASDTFTYRVIDTVDYDEGTVQEVEGVVVIAIDQNSKGTPAANRDSVNIDEGGSTTLNILTNDELSPLSGAPISAITIIDSFNLASNFSLAVDGALAYTHNSDEIFVDTLIYTITDEANMTSAPTAVVISVNMKNDNAPTILPDTIIVNEGGTVTANILINDSDIDLLTTLSALPTPAVAPSDPLSSVTILGDGTVTFVHSGKENVTVDSFEVAISDVVSYDATAPHIVNNKAIVIITPVNDNAPEVSPFTENTVLENGTITFDFTGKVTDIDGGTFTVSLPSGVTNTGNAVLAGNVVTYTHKGVGTEIFRDTIQVVVSDAADALGNSNSVPVSIPVVIVPQNDEIARGVDELFVINENDTVIGKVNTAAIIDADRHDAIPNVPFGNSFRVVALDPPANGTVVLNGDGSFTYINLGLGIEEVADSFTYVIVDSTSYHDNVHTSEKVTVRFTVNNTNDERPATALDTIVVKEGETATVLTNGERSVLANDSDLDTGTVLSAVLTDTVTAGTLLLNSDGTFTYTHDGSEIYSDQFSYVAFDSVNTSDTTIVTIIVNAKPPVLDSAFYSDRDADGEVDQMTLYFNHTVDLSFIDFDLIWSDDSSVVETGTPVPGATPTIVTVPLIGTAIKTAGTMDLTIHHTNPAVAVIDTIVTVEDRAAPVVIAAFFDGQSLSVSLSEPITTVSESPFVLYVNGGTDSLIPVLGATVADSGSTYVYSYSDEIVAGDSINIALTGTVADGNGTVQTLESNLKQPIFLNNSFSAAYYIDTNYAADGRIDLIRIETLFPISEEMVLAMKDSISFNPARALTITEIEVTEYGFAIAVEDSSETISTAVSELDVLTITLSGANTSQTLSAAVVAISDSLRPVVLEGIYSETTDTTLTVHFSEPVAIHAALEQPYTFFDISSEREFTMTLANPVYTDSLKQSIVYTVTEKSILYPVTGDSLAISTDMIIADTLGIYTNQSLFAPLSVQSQYDLGLDFYVLPQPLELTEVTETFSEPVEIDQKVRDHYQLEQNGIFTEKGVLFAVEAKGPLKQPEFHSGVVQVFDNVGNAVTDTLSLTFVEKENGTIAGVAVWDGKNIRSRVVGRGTLLVAAQVTVESDEGEASRIISKDFKAVLGVKK